MRKLPATFKTDLFMLPVFVAVAVTGVGLHISGHKGVEAVIGVWKILHIMVSVVFVILTTIHIKQHWGWYINLSKSFNRRNMMTLLLTAATMFELLSGVYLLTDITTGAIYGHLHWIIGGLLLILGIVHIAGRWKPLKHNMRLINLPCHNGKSKRIGTRKAPKTPAELLAISY